MNGQSGSSETADDIRAQQQQYHQQQHQHPEHNQLHNHQQQEQHDQQQQHHGYSQQTDHQKDNQVREDTFFSFFNGLTTKRGQGGGVMVYPGI